MLNNLFFYNFLVAKIMLEIISSKFLMLIFQFLFFQHCAITIYKFTLSES